MASLETRTPSRSFPLMASPPLVLVGGSQGTGGAGGGGSSQSRITESKIYEQTPIILYNVDNACHV